MAKTIFSDGDRSQGILGTRVWAAWLNKVFNHRHDGLDQDGSAPHTYAAAGGSANAITLALSPALTQHIVGMPIYFKASATNTGAATVQVNSLSAVPLTLADGSAIEYGAIRSGCIYNIIYSGTSYVILNATTRVGLTQICLTPNALTGYLIVDGSIKNRSTYPELYAWAVAQGIITTEANWLAGKSGLFSYGDGAATFRLPQSQGEFPRFFDGGRGVDAGRVFGAGQLDAIQNITGKFGIDNVTLDATTPTGAFYYDPPGTYEADTGPGGVAAGSYAYFDASRVVRTAAETRTRNITFTLQIKT